VTVVCDQLKGDFKGIPIITRIPGNAMPVAAHFANLHGDERRTYGGDMAERCKR